MHRRKPFSAHAVSTACRLMIVRPNLTVRPSKTRAYFVRLRVGPMANKPPASRPHVGRYSISILCHLRLLDQWAGACCWADRGRPNSPESRTEDWFSLHLRLSHSGRARQV